MTTHTAPFVRKNWVAYLPSQDKECEEEDEEGDSSHQFGLLQHPWPEEAMNQGYLLSCPSTIASPCPWCPRSPQPPSCFALGVVEVSEVRTVLPCPISPELLGTSLQRPHSPGVQRAQIEAGNEAVRQPGVGMQEETAGGHQPQQEQQQLQFEAHVQKEGAGEETQHTAVHGVLWGEAGWSGGGTCPTDRGGGTPESSVLPLPGPVWGQGVSYIQTYTKCDLRLS